jgi:hypothetical protein
VVLSHGVVLVQAMEMKQVFPGCILGIGIGEGLGWRIHQGEVEALLEAIELDLGKRWHLVGVEIGLWAAAGLAE